jgi:hypothetical protein
MLPFANLQLAFDSTRERLHFAAPQWFGANDFGENGAFLSMLI